MLSFNEVIESSLDKYVFRRNSKDMTSNFGKIFARLLEQADLLIDRRNDKKRTLYSLRHYYATQMLTHSLVTAYQLAEYMGTSVGMIKKHYGHLELLMVAEKFVGEGSINSELKLPKIIKKN
jgi:integrase